MRDILITAIVFGSLPFILKRPWYGIIGWCWLSYMNPHKQAWGFATNMPFAMLVALATILGMFFSREPKKVPWTRETIVLLLLICWMAVTTVFAYFPGLAWAQFEKVIKIQSMTFVTLMLITNRERLTAMVWMIALSLGYYGIKGGIFTIVTGGAFRVQGPTGTFIGGNNEMALALIMCVPLMRYLQLQNSRTLMRWGLGAAMVLTAIAAVGSQSRGALVAIAAMGAMLWLKSRRKIATAVLIVCAGGIAFSIMPSAYYERMSTIKTYEQDASARGRLNAWGFAWNLAKDRPLVGGGFETFQEPLFRIYAPDPSDVHDVHSIYFEMLGEHGFVGLGLFVLLGVLAWHSASRLMAQAKGAPDRRWISDLMAMTQVSIVGYAAGGAFLGLAYFDLYYHLVAIIVITARIQVDLVASASSGDAAVWQENLGSRTAATLAPTPCK